MAKKRERDGEGGRGDSVTDQTAKRKPRNWRERLQSDAWRHVLAIAFAGVLTNVLAMSIVLLAPQWILSPDANRSEAMSTYIQVSALLVFSMYGPFYTLLARYAWKGLEGQEFANALRGTRPRQLSRTLVVGSPAESATVVAFIALVAVGLIVINPEGSVLLFAVGLLAVAGSWILLLGTFAMEYAREWQESDGFAFPGEEPVQYDDFVYLSVQASTTYSTSDVSTLNRRARRLVTAHSVSAFVFATVILALLVALLMTYVAT